MTKPCVFMLAALARRSPAAVLVVFSALAQDAPPLLHGTWTATAGPTRVFRGTWTAQVSRQTPNIVAGSWTLFDDAGDVSLQGTWSAHKSRLGCEGVWTAEVVGSSSVHGTWTADIAGGKDKTLRAMLESTAEKEAAGSWRSGPYEGNWWLKGAQNRSP